MSKADLPIGSPKTIVIAGASSNTGKTTLLCDLLRALANDGACEAIKLTRGHYRSCGKDPHTCCVSHLLGAQPTIRYGRERTFALGKDTGRYWDAGASEVQWVIVTDAQVEQGIGQALAGVKAGRVLIEGTSVLKFIEPDFALLAMRSDQAQIKPSAQRAIRDGRIHAVYISDEGELGSNDLIKNLIEGLPLYRPQNFVRLVDRIKLAISSNL